MQLNTIHSWGEGVTKGQSSSYSIIQMMQKVVRMKIQCIQDNVFTNYF